MLYDSFKFFVARQDFFWQTEFGSNLRAFVFDSTVLKIENFSYLCCIISQQHDSITVLYHNFNS